MTLFSYIPRYFLVCVCECRNYNPHKFVSRSDKNPVQCDVNLFLDVLCFASTFAHFIFNIFECKKVTSACMSLAFFHSYIKNKSFRNKSTSYVNRDVFVRVFVDPSIRPSISASRHLCYPDCFPMIEKYNNSLIDDKDDNVQ